jgi:chemotaxis protein methyltransferase WspC
MNPSLYIENILTDTLGLDLASMGKGFLERTQESLLKKSGYSSLEDYVTRLKSSQEEKEKIIEAVVVPETWFFRDHGPFDYLKFYLLDQGKQKTSKEKIRILSVPCSTGEEPYSIVMTLLEAGMSPKEFVVDAVDLSDNALRIARGGRYGKGSFRGMTDEMRRSYFHWDDDERNVRISEQVISGVRFYRDNLLRPASMAQMQTYHVIFCRNLLIYLHTKAKETAFSHIDRLLRPGGMLIAGHAEVLFWRQRGYLLVDHPRSFALRKPLGKEERSCIPSPLPAPERGEIPPRQEADRRGSLGTAGKSQAVIAPSKDFKNHDDRGPEMEFFKALDASPTEVLIQARSLADRGEMEEALSACRRYLEADRPCAEVYYLMGLIHESRNSVVEAEECYLKALYLDPDHFETLIHAGLMYERRQDHEKATLFKNRITRIERHRQPHPYPGPPLEGEGVKFSSSPLKG